MYFGCDVMSRLGQLGQSLSLDAQSHPFIFPLGANHLTLVEIETGLVPIKTAPLEPRAPNLEHLCSKLFQEPLAIALLPVALFDKQIFEIDARDASPGAVVVEIEGHACYRAVGVGDEERASEALGECSGRGVVVRKGAREDLLGSLDLVTG
ncbi:hypothetical protein ACJQWK_11789 [Exserohilum turcicum]